MTKHFKVANGGMIQIKITDRTERHVGFFKYKVVSIVNGIVTFELLSTPRALTDEAGWKLMSIGYKQEQLIIASCSLPEYYENTLYVHGTEAECDSQLIEMPINIFNMAQIGMLAWNVSIIKHKSKLIYDICTICNSYNERKITLSATNTFSIDSYTCCVLPSAIYVPIEKTEGVDSIMYLNKCHLVLPQWYKNKNNIGDSYTRIQYFNLHRIFSALESFGPKVYIQNVCPSCLTPHTNVEWLDVETCLDLRRCARCAAMVHTCMVCANETLTDIQVGTKYVGRCCSRLGSCYACNIEQDSTTKTLIYEHNSDKWLCIEHTVMVLEHGWDSMRLTSEQGYSFKIPMSHLEVLTEQSVIRAHEIIQKEPACALEWEYPFSKLTTKTEVRERAIWLFNQEQKECGYQDLFIAKHDGSLPSFATEFVSKRPSTLKMWHKLYFDGVLGRLAKYIDADKVKAVMHSIGGHIHISRGSFTPTQVTRALKFLYSNQKFMEFICNRSFGNSSYYVPSTGIHPLQFAYFKDSRSPEKYTLARVLHAQHNNVEMGTIELRAFKSPSTDVEVIQNIEFMFALHTFVKVVPTKDITNSDAFISVVNEYMKMFPLLHEKIVARNTKAFSVNVPNIPGLYSFNRPRKKSMKQYACASCNTTFTAEASDNRENNPLCTSCSRPCRLCFNLTNETHGFCNECSEYYTFDCHMCTTITANNDSYTYIDDSRRERHVCESCYDLSTYYCDDCDMSFENGMCCDCEEDSN